MRNNTQINVHTKSNPYRLEPVKCSCEIDSPSYRLWSYLRITDISAFSEKQEGIHYHLYIVYNIHIYIFSLLIPYITYVIIIILFSCNVITECIQYLCAKSLKYITWNLYKYGQKSCVLCAMCMSFFDYAKTRTCHANLCMIVWIKIGSKGVT